MKLKPGLRLKSAACSTEVMVVKGSGEHRLCCGGHAMGTAMEIDSVDLDQNFARGSLMGKRYVTEDGSLELLCTKPGEGNLSLGELPLTVKATQALPSSD